MKVYGIDKVTELETYDLNTGRLFPSKRFVKTHSEVKEVIQYEEIIHPNGGISRIPQVITPYIPSYDEYEDIIIYISYADMGEVDEVQPLIGAKAINIDDKTIIWLGGENERN